MSIARSILLVLFVVSTPLSPLGSLTCYLTYLETDAVDRASVTGSNLDRLPALKTKWDPDNFFRQNATILPQPSGSA